MLRQLSSRTSLQVKLIATLITLVIVALVVISCVGTSILRGYLLGQTDQALQNNQVQHTAGQAAAGSFTSANEMAQGGFAVWWLPSGGSIEQVVQPGGMDLGPTHTGISTLPSSVTSALVANPGQTVTVAGQVSGDRWRVTSFQAIVNGTSGTVIIGTDVSSVYTTVQRLIGVDIIVSIVILVVLLLAGIAMVRANLRTLVDIEETAGEIAEGHLNRRVPERDPRTEIGRLGRSLNVMLSQIEAAFHAREESEAAAHQSEERMRRFIADASHELRTPLTAIRGFAEYYRQRGGLVRRWDKDRPAAPDPGGGQTNGLLPDDLDRIMQRLEKEAARMGLLVEDLLLLARMDQQRPLARQPIDLLSLTADAVHDARLLAPSRTIELSVQRGAAFLVTGDEPRLRQVIGNLMSNALTHTPNGTPIEVLIGSGTLDPRVPGSPAAVTLDVTDHGPGMSAEQAQRAFERFYRADQARTRATGGSGLGLAIVNALVVAHGGVASVRTAPDRGATFRIALPLAPEAQGGMADDDDLDEPDEAPDAPGTPDHAWAPGGSTGEDM
ncbi:MAG TPA: HAMP domain-containing sensor histidine kinase [Streptosporangiaceae bacterium]|nr:HAMP domain-containing sensor histidine kinase [Streptosporangiaceae bacterium]